MYSPYIIQDCLIEKFKRSLATYFVDAFVSLPVHCFRCDIKVKYHISFFPNREREGDENRTHNLPRIFAERTADMQRPRLRNTLSTNRNHLEKPHTRVATLKQPAILIPRDITPNTRESEKARCLLRSQDTLMTFTTSCNSSCRWPTATSSTTRHSRLRHLMGKFIRFWECTRSFESERLSMTIWRYVWPPRL